MSLILDGSNGVSDIDGTAATPAIRGTDANTGIFFPAADTIAFSEGGVEAMRIDSAGNVGIGTSSPVSDAKLTIGSDNTESYVFLQRSGAGRFDAAIGNTGGDILFRNGVDSSTVAGLTERMRIDSNGNLLVGQTAVGFANINGISISNATNQNIINHASSAVSGTAYIQFGFNGGGIGNILQSGTTAVSYNTSSDYRLKENIVPMTGALDKVAQLKPVTYKWKSDGSDGQGFIAHELQTVVPDCVTGEKDAVDAEGNPQYQGIDTSFLVATLTAAIQELKATVDAQAARIAALENPLSETE
jgi:hypothetical protein